MRRKKCIMVNISDLFRVTAGKLSLKQQSAHNKIAWLSVNGTKSDLPVLVELLRIFPNGANISHRDTNDHSPFYFSLIENAANPEIALTMWKLGADVKARTAHGPIIIATAHSAAYLPILEDCLSKGVDPNSQHLQKLTPVLGFACQFYNVGAVKLLVHYAGDWELQHGLLNWACGPSCDRKLKLKPSDIKKVFKILSTKVINLNSWLASGSFFGPNPWDGVLSGRAVKLQTEILLKYGAEINIEIDGFFGKTSPLLKCTSMVGIEFLLSQGANPYFVSADNKSLLHQVAVYGPMSEAVLNCLDRQSIKKLPTRFHGELPEDLIPQHLSKKVRSVIMDQIHYLACS